MIPLSVYSLLLPLAALLGLLILEYRADSGIAVPAFFAILRSAAQLTLVGFVLSWIFSEAGALWLSVCMLIMLVAAIREVYARQDDRQNNRAILLSSGIALALGAALSMGIALAVLRIGPFDEPRALIPLLGMVLGNAMNGLSLVLQGFRRRVRLERERITELLALGQTAEVALGQIRREELRSGMIPVINSMATVGIVFLPGMMSGQLLAGASVMQSIYYQYFILVLIMLCTLLSLRIGLKLFQRSLFDSRMRLLA